MAQKRDASFSGGLSQTLQTPPRPSDSRQDSPPPDDPKLPSVLLLGDSISFGYAPEVRRLLTGRANVHRVLGTVDTTVQGGLVLDTRNAILQMDNWLGKRQWKVVHFNWGLHDVKMKPSGEHQVPLAEYEKNLDILARRLQKTGAHLLWAATTPVPSGRLSPPRVAGHEALYNAAARPIMARHRIPINDLHTLGKELQRAGLQKPANVHFTDEGSARLAEQVAAAISPLLTR